MAPTESLLDPPVLLGVLRVLAKHDGEAPSLEAISKELGTVQAETFSPVNLGRTGERNLIRNSGQYWKGLGLIQPKRGLIAMTPLGSMVANNGLTQSEFAAIIVEQTVLPNPWTYTNEEIDKWKAVNLEIRPLALILEIINLIKLDLDAEGGFLTPEELVKIVIPLAGQNTSPAVIAEYVFKYRNNKAIVSGWPDCAPEANDERLAREFLLFLGNFGFLRSVAGVARSEEKYFLAHEFDVRCLARQANASIFTTNPEVQKRVIERIEHSDLPSVIERQRVAINILSRPQQSKFRDDVLKAYACRCLLSDEAIPSVLEAAHIVPVKNNGADLIDNGFCLRVDIHRLYDAGNIKIDHIGNVELIGAARASLNYSRIHKKITVPEFVKPANLQWRYKYL